MPLANGEPNPRDLVEFAAKNNMKDSYGDEVYKAYKSAANTHAPQTVAGVDFNSLIDAINYSRSNSALDYALKAARETNSFNAQQAALNRSFQQSSAERAMQFEAEQNQKAMDFSERMASTQYQRGIEDLKAAGLSPLLAYSNLQTGSPVGSAGSSAQASGSQASGVKADTSTALGVESDLLSQFFAILSLNVNSGLKLKELQNQLDITDKNNATRIASRLIPSLSLSG